MIDGRRSRHAELVQAAFAVVAEVGFEGLRLRRVAADVGIDQSTLHHYFATKTSLIEAVAQHATTRLAATAPPTDVEPATALCGHLQALTQMMRSNPALFTVSAELDLRARRDPIVRRTLDQHESGWREALTKLFSAHPSPTRPPDEATELVIATVKGVRLTPELAAPVLDQLASLLTAGPTTTH